MLKKGIGVDIISIEKSGSESSQTRKMDLRGISIKLNSDYNYRNDNTY